MDKHLAIGFVVACSVATSGCGRDAPSPSSSTGAAATPPAAVPAPARADAGLPSAAAAERAAAGDATGVQDPVASAASQSTTAADATEALRKQSLALADKRKAFFDHDRKLRAEDAECVRLAREVEDLQRQLSEREAAIRERLAADPEWQRLQGEVVEAQRGHDALQRTAMAGLRAAAGTNVFTRRPPPVPRPAR